MLIMKNFDYWLQCFNNQNMNEFNNDYSGVVWLKLKSIIRKDLLEKFLNENLLSFSEKLNNTFIYLYSKYCEGFLKEENIDKFLRECNSDELADINSKFDIIENDLYKMQECVWGGDATNSLDKKIVSYIKQYYSYSKIMDLLDNEISINTRHYTLNSWYNNWTTILTEHIFKSHKKTISAVGKIKSVDFFVDGIPIDLKITYFPKAYLEQKRKEKGLGSEITKLKNIAKECSINYDKKENNETIKYQIIEKIKDTNNLDYISMIDSLKKENLVIMEETISNKVDLMRWLYENQGEMRFGSENRLFMILVDKNDIDNSWKLKRNFTKLKPAINTYLDNFDANKIKNSKIDFIFKGKKYSTLSDILFISY